MPIYFESEQKLAEMISKSDMRACVVGVGTIGLPLATFLASRGFSVTGFDISRDRVDGINGNTVKFEYNKLLGEALGKKKIHATTDPSEIKSADIIFVCVPTPLSQDNSINLSILTSASETIAKNFSRGTVVVYESSVSIGSTMKMANLIESISGLKVGKDFGVAYCPERYNPTLPIETFPHIVYADTKDETDRYTMDKVSRVISAIDGKSLFIAKGVYERIITAGVKEVSTIETAEATKLFENIFRDVNIALVNEMAKLMPKFGIDTYEVVNAAKTKQFAFLPHYPGIGVGGECIPVDTWYLIKQAEEMGFDTKIMRVAREVNDSMPEHTVGMLRDALMESGKSLRGARVTILGLSYKKNIPDTRLSPSLFVIDILKSEGADVVVCDPVMELVKSRYTLTPMTDAFRGSDAVILSTDHDVFKKIDMRKAAGEMRTKIFVDGRNFFKRSDVEAAGFVYKSVGKPS